MFSGTAAAGRPSANGLTLIDMGDSGQAGVALALSLPAAGAKDQAAGEVASAVLGGGYSSRLNREIRIKRGLSYGAASAFDARRQASVLHAAVQTRIRGVHLAARGPQLRVSGDLAPWTIECCRFGPISASTGNCQIGL